MRPYVGWLSYPIPMVLVNWWVGYFNALVVLRKGVGSPIVVLVGTHWYLFSCVDWYWQPMSIMSPLSREQPLGRDLQSWLETLPGHFPRHRRYLHLHHLLPPSLMIQWLPLSMMILANTYRSTSFFSRLEPQWIALLWSKLSFFFIGCFRWSTDCRIKDAAKLVFCSV